MKKYILITWTLLLSACTVGPGEVAGGLALATVAGATINGSELEQTYYLGTFDPREQIPPTIYRVKVKASSAVLNETKFASGWVPAEFIDSLSGRVKMTMGEDGKISYAEEEGVSKNIFKLNRRMIQFGPEGFREVPSEHRLVVVMGVDPSAFFSAVDMTLGQLAPAQLSKVKDIFNRQLTESQLSTRKYQDKLHELENSLEQ